MLRKYEVASEEWSEENVRLCAARQREILENAVRCVAPGGRLLYSTCTFSLEENEQNVAWLLDTYPDFSLLPVKAAVAGATSPGIDIDGRDLSLCRRFYPHVSAGEGQFLALLGRTDDSAATRPQKSAILPLNRTETDTVTAFFDETLTSTPRGTLCRLRDNIFLLPDVSLPQRGVFAAGMLVGTLQKNRIEPHHHFYSALGTSVTRQLHLSADDPRVTQYLRGEEIDCPELSGVKNGFTAVLFEGAALGGGKCVAGRLKNHYPKGLRLIK